jgi:hypothetical protein
MGNLSLPEIQQMMEETLSRFGFDKVERALMLLAGR